MATKPQVVVSLRATAEPEMLPAVRGAVGVLARQLGFGEAAIANLQQGTEQACRLVSAGRPGNDGDWKLRLEGFADRMEVTLAGAAMADEKAAAWRLLEQLLDRVVYDRPDTGEPSLTLVQYRPGGAT